MSSHKRQPILAALPVNGAAALIGVAALLVRRLLFGVLVLLAIIFLSYFGLDMARGTVFRAALVRAASKTPAYLGRLAEGDLGLAAAGSITLRPLPLAEVVPAMLSRSLGLLAAALLIAALVGVALGVWAAGRRHANWSVAILLISNCSRRIAKSGGVRPGFGNPGRAKWDDHSSGSPGLNLWGMYLV